MRRTTSPSYPLDIVASTNETLEVKSSNTAGTAVDIKNTSTGGRDYQLFTEGSGGSYVGTFGIWDNTAGATRLLMESSGYLALGPSISPNHPGYPLHIFSNVNNTVQIDSSSTTGTALTLNNTDTGGRAYQLFTTGSSNAIAVGSFGLWDTTGGAARLVVDSTGKVGIGTTSPQVALDVNGSARVGNDSASCTSTNQGEVKYTGNTFYGCNGSIWVPMDSGMHFVSTQTTSNSASLQFSGLNWSSSYNTLFLNCSGLVTSNANANFLYEVGEGAGPTWETSADYADVYTLVDNTTSFFTGTDVTNGTKTTNRRPLNLAWRRFILIIWVRRRSLNGLRGQWEVLIRVVFMAKPDFPAGLATRMPLPGLG